MLLCLLRPLLCAPGLIYHIDLKRLVIEGRSSGTGEIYQGYYPLWVPGANLPEELTAAFQVHSPPLPPELKHLSAAAETRR